jgi:hypothetical protein
MQYSARTAGAAARKGLLLLLLFAAGCTFYLGSASTARAGENYCGVYLQPYGQNGDRCYSLGRYIHTVSMVTYERAGCLSLANSSNQLLTSWQCAAAGSAPAAATYFALNDDGVRRKGVIRNNNLSYKGYFAGALNCYRYEC